MAEAIEIHAYHGWGFDADFWEPLTEIIPKEISFKAASRGYFGTPQFPRFNQETKKRIVFVHSFGLHWCTTAVLSKADYLVIFNGFGDFHPTDEPARKRSREKLDLTIRAFEKNPVEVLRSFRDNCFKPEEHSQDTVQSDLETVRALSDLNAMKELTFPIIDLDFGATIITVDGDQDQILGEPRGAKLIESYVGNKHHKVFEGRGHALPTTNPQDCWSYLCSVIPIFQRL